MRYSARREMLSQMVKDRQIKNMGRGQNVLSRAQNLLTEADIVPKARGNVSSSRISG
jgi:hypothetical protein